MQPTSRSKLNSKIINKLREANILLQDEPPLNLCSGCSGISIARMREAGGYKHPVNVYDLPRSAEECDICEMLVDQISRHGLKPDSHPGDGPRDERYAIALKQHGFNKKEKRTSFVALLQMPWMEHVIVIERFTGATGVKGDGFIAVCRIYTDSAVRSRPTKGKPTLLALRIPAEVNLDMLAIQVKYWMRQCLTNHEICNGPPGAPSKPPMPTRVLDVEKERLYETGHAPGRYIALSHTWGGYVQGRTVKSNLQERLKGFSFDTLPLNFRDAIKVTKALRIRYLWIDSLCIVQDDAEDWGRESKTMTGLYMSSYLTIAATRAQDSGVGFLGRRDLSKVLKVPGEGGEYFYICPDTRPDYSEVVYGAPLNSRAWVVQERVLSIRTLHFSRAQVYWECACEIIGEDMNYEAQTNDANSTSQTSFALLGGAKGKTPKAWWEILENYTACGLTHQSDKLIAIDGIVSWISSQFGLKFLAGVWEDSASVGLLWAADRDDLEPLPEIKAPSWSWASKKGPIKHFNIVGDYEDNPSTYITESSYADQSETPQPLTLHADLCSLRSGLHFGSLMTSSFPFELENSNTRYRQIIKAGNRHDLVYGWAVLDQESESSLEAGLNTNSETLDIPGDGIYWVVVRSQVEEPEPDPETGALKTPFYDTHYCILVRKAGSGDYVRVGAGAIHGAKRLKVEHKGVKVV